MWIVVVQERGNKKSRDNFLPLAFDLELDVERFFELAEFALEGFDLLGYIEFFLEIVKAFSERRGDRVRYDAGQFVHPVANILLRSQRRELFD